MREFVESEQGKICYWILGILAVIIWCFVLIPPLYATWNKATPLICGIPFSVVMSFVIMLALAIILCLLYHVQKIRKEL